MALSKRTMSSPLPFGMMVGSDLPMLPRLSSTLPSRDVEERNTRVRTRPSRVGFPAIPARQQKSGRRLAFPRVHRRLVGRWRPTEEETRLSVSVRVLEFEETRKHLQIRHSQL